MKDTLHLDPPVPLQQTPAFAAAIRAIGGRARWCPLSDGGQVTVVSRHLPLVGELRLASRGPIFTTDTGPEERADLLRDLRLHLVNAPDPQAAGVLRAAGFGQVMTGATVAWLDTRADPVAQLARSAPKWRNAARQGARAGLDLWMRPFDRARDRWLFDRDAEQQRARGYRALPAELVSAFSAVAPGDVILAGADLDGRCVAAMLLIRHGRSATYQIGWSGAEGRRCCAHHAILIHAATRLHAQGVTGIDLGTLNTRTAPGLARFKLGSGARPHKLGGTWLRLPGWRGRTTGSARDRLRD